MGGINPAPHRRGPKATDTWITPRPILDRLGPFDLDPCAAAVMPWPTATIMLTEKENGLRASWTANNPLIWLNPPYGRQLGVWLGKLAAGATGIALTFARTDTQAFHEYVWPRASAMVFLRGRITFCQTDGQPAKKGHNSGGPSVLIAYGERGTMRLMERCMDAPEFGRFVWVNRPRWA